MNPLCDPIFDPRAQGGAPSPPLVPAGINRGVCGQGGAFGALQPRGGPILPIHTWRRPVNPPVYSLPCRRRRVAGGGFGRPLALPRGASSWMTGGASPHWPRAPAPGRRPRRVSREGFTRLAPAADVLSRALLALPRPAARPLRRRLCRRGLLRPARSRWRPLGGRSSERLTATPQGGAQRQDAGPPRLALAGFPPGHGAALHPGPVRQLSLS
jgi:hypothetical protein